MTQDEAIESASLVDDHGATVCVIMRPPRKGELGYWVGRNDSAQVALAKVAQGLDRGQYGWLATFNYDAGPDEDGDVAVTIVVTEPELSHGHGRAEYGDVFVAMDDFFLCQACATADSIDLGDDDVQTWEVGGRGWTSPCVCRDCKLSIPVIIDGFGRCPKCDSILRLCAYFDPNCCHCDGCGWCGRAPRQG